MRDMMYLGEAQQYCLGSGGDEVLDEHIRNEMILRLRAPVAQG